MKGFRMRVGIVDKWHTFPYKINKDQMGGFGISSNFGESLPAKLIAWAKKGGRNVPISSLGYLASIFTQKGHDVFTYKDGLLKEVDLVIIPSSIICYKEEIELAKRIKAKGNAIVGSIGPFAGTFPELYQEVFDFIIQGEPEEIGWRIADGWIPRGIVEGNRVEDLDRLPFPLWKPFDIRDYSYSPIVNRRPFLPVLSSRGCTYDCIYCPYKYHYGKWRSRSVESVVEEIKYLQKDYDVRGLIFRDPLFTFKMDRVCRLSEEIIRENIRVEWACETHPNLLDEGLMDLMYDAGMRGLNLGIESADEEILIDVNRKAIRDGQVQKVIKHCHKKGIRVAAFYILGLPQDTESTITRTIEYAKSLNTCVGQFFICTPFPGTSFYESLKDRIVEDWSRFDSFTPVFEHDNLSGEQLLSLKDRAYRSYYFRPAYIRRYWKHIATSIYRSLVG